MYLLFIQSVYKIKSVYCTQVAT